MSREYESALLASMMQDVSIVWSAGIVPEDFSTTDHRLIYAAVRECAELDIQPDLLAVCDHAKSVAPEVISRISEAVPSSANWKFYRDQVRSERLREQLVRLCRRTAETADTASDVLGLISSVHEELTALSTDRSATIEAVRDLVRSALGAIEERYKAKGRIPGLTTGFRGLDDKILGFRPERLYYIGGRPSDGKSALMLDIARRQADRGIPVGFVSLENSSDEIMERLFSQDAALDSRAVISGALKASDFKGLADAAQRIYDMTLYLSAAPGLTTSGVLSVIRQLVQAKGAKIVYVDYLQLIQRDAGVDTMREHIVRTSVALKTVARTLKVPIVVAAQLRRDAQGRRPGLNDFMESGQVEQDADAAMLLWHDESADTSSIIVAKARDGATGIVPVYFDKPHVRFMPREAVESSGGA